MSILIDEKSRVVVQGITGGAGVFHTKKMLEYGTKVVAGTSPGKGGHEIEGVSVYDTIEECVKEQGADVSVMFIPPRFVLDGAIEAIEAGIRLLVVIPEMIPVHDMLKIRLAAVKKGCTVIGGNTAGLISPGKCNVGIMPEITFKQGRIGIVSRSGSLNYYVADTLTKSGLGETTCVGLGGDPILGSTFSDILPMFENDPQTEGVVIVGEIGGVYEEEAAGAIKKMKKPVVFFVAGRNAPKGKRMGHAGAIVEGDMGTADSKIRAMKEAGAGIAYKFSEIPGLFGSKVGTGR
ncbi:MAG: succinate--CoA ligase subunit alpha [Chloroflexi bacterium]|nr:succinate--CoA ligase subunit alpha [Chloroflexota bacterium]